MIANHPEQRHVRIHVDYLGLAIQGKMNRHENLPQNSERLERLGTSSLTLSVERNYVMCFKSVKPSRTA